MMHGIRLVEGNAFSKAILCITDFICIQIKAYLKLIEN